MNSSLLAKLYSAIDEISSDDMGGLSATEKGEAIRAHFAEEGDEPMLDEFLSWFDEE